MEKKIKRMRNHWITVEHEGLSKKIATGPKGKKSKMDITLFQNVGGESQEVLTIICTGTETGNVRTLVLRNGEAIFEILTDRDHGGMRAVYPELERRSPGGWRTIENA